MHHLADDGGDLRGAEVEAPVEILHRIEDFGMSEMRIVQRRDLHPVGVEFGVRIIKPAILQRFLDLALGLVARIQRRRRSPGKMGLAGRAFAS
jgi:hypothetical protein